jgi:hypothetical protein
MDFFRGASRLRPRAPAAARPKPNMQIGSGSKVDVDRLLAAARVAPKLELIEWEGDRSAPRQAIPRQEASTMPQDDDDPRTYDVRRRRIRDRYISTRFPGVAQCSTDLESFERVIKAARLFFEEERSDAALELLEMAIEECPRDASLWLARLEILFLIRDATRFAETARAFHDEHPRAEADWAEICRLGRALAPDDKLFGPRRGPREHEHYGPWPHTPNWIRAPWDLTADVAAADFHRAVARTAGHDANSKPRTAA